MKIQYVDRKFRSATLAIIEQANEIIAEYAGQGFDLTLRQLYYQFVSRDLIPNTQRSYNNLGSIINDARLAGLVDWDAIVDRTRNVQSLSHWDSPKEIVGAIGRSYHIDMWENQPARPEVWIEKDALAGVFEGVCDEFDVPYFSCRGYTSQSEMWAGAQRLQRWKKRGQRPIILHFGDHDPSGKDMTRDIIDRMELFMGGVELDRLALNMDQIDQYSPPPNPAKSTDARYATYTEEYGDESWELDALEPAVLEELARAAIQGLMDSGTWAESIERQDAERGQLERVSDKWDSVVKFIK